MRVTAVQAFMGARGSWRRGVQSMRTDAPLKSPARPLNPSLRPKKPAGPCWDTLLLLHSGPEGGFRLSCPLLNGGMTGLTRRRSKDAHAESWQIFYGDVQVGTIRIRAGVPV